MGFQKGSRIMGGGGQKQWLVDLGQPCLGACSVTSLRGCG